MTKFRVIKVGIDLYYPQYVQDGLWHNFVASDSNPSTVYFFGLDEAVNYIKFRRADVRNENEYVIWESEE